MVFLQSNKDLHNITYNRLFEQQDVHQVTFVIALRLLNL